MQSIVASRTLMWHVAARSAWPEDTVHTSDDVIVNGASLVHAARSGSTPLVRIGPAGSIEPHEDGPARPFITVVLSRVQIVDHPSGARRAEVWIDAETAGCRPILSAVRLIGRASGAPRRRMRLRPDLGSPAAGVRLPSDLRAGDLVAIPCSGALPLSEVRGRQRVDRLDDGRSDPGDDFPYLPSCLK